MSWRIDQSDAGKLPLADQSVDLIFGSPPYCDARTYGINAQRGCAQWIDWMLGVTREACRVSRGLVLWVCAGVTRDHCYWPACEGLLHEWWKQGGQCWRPVYWHRVGIPGSGGKQWLASRIEYVLAFKGTAGVLPWADNTANGSPPKWGPGGELSYRDKAGRRVNNLGEIVKQDTHARHHGGKRVGGAPRFGMRVTMGTGPTGGQLPNRETAFPFKANPGNLIDVPVGGGKLGHPLAHENEAPFPLKLAEWFVRGWCPPGGTVCDPFSGSGTTAHAAFNLGRTAHCFDLRLSQVFLGRKRMREVESATTQTATPAA